ncbi:DEAD/DEAH box helicase family protein, partial [Kurthia sp. Dielmo]|uniref:DEAD/DEAH box helicase family protein n=1 Tax=Kurthia sp. Dielmo TaxID=1033738 RepID=UPI001123D688
MKIQFKDLTYQTDAINAVLSVFEGQQIRKSEFTIMDQAAQGKLFGEKGVGNKIDISISKLLQNVQQLQINQGIPIAKDIAGTFPQFNIEMETGTGKTFVYLKSILEMNRKHGFTKFIIVVPSVAIKEGVMKTLEMTRQYFKTQMQGQVYRSFMYDSSRLNDVQAFATSDDVEIMVINIQAFSKSSKNNDNMNIIYRNDMDALYGIAPIELIAETNPIVIIDEPQSVDNTEKAQVAIAALNPSVAFRFSATHKNKSYPLIYKLGPVEAYQQKLVKQIEVAGIKRSIDGNEAYLKLVSIKATAKTIKATVEMLVKTGSELVKKEVKLKQGDDLYVKSKRIAAYEAVGFVKDISAEQGNEYIEFSGEPSIIRLSQSQNEDLEIKRGQIRKTIEEHLNKELKLNKLGVKVLSLFFIDNVSNYRQYDDEGNELLGIYGQIFEEEYKDTIKSAKYQALRDLHVPVEEIHNGYFSIDSKKKVKNTTGSSKEDETTYNIIMKNKEDLLTMYDEEKGKMKAAHKYRFIFSHSALKEGWDNPNVFQICTLIESTDTITKRQKIGRGLRIAVNQDGERVPGFEVNTLTVMANESYDEFAKGLQTEYEEGMEFGIFKQDIFSSLVIKVDEHTGLKTPFGHENSEKLVKYLKENEYIDAKNKGTV